MRVDVDGLAVVEDEQRGDAGAEVIAAAVAAAAGYLADAVAIADAGEGASRLPVQVAALLVTERAVVDELVVVATRAQRAEPGNDRGPVEASVGGRCPRPRPCSARSG